MCFDRWTLGRGIGLNLAFKEKKNFAYYNKCYIFAALKDKKQKNMDVTISLDSILNFLHSFSLTADNKKWIADHLYEEAKAEEKDNRELTPTEEKYIARAMLGHQQIQEGKCKDSEEVFKMLDERYK